ncbi:MAG: sulfide/dihydroorotate dehydrogenase-like FAD/NAD-binding protein [Dehalococcoidia bacterium]|nr:sulfide/dihydroorotate dehydrogenase-like FAD/NAD-binding protein [Dehalococcoidia bacterium]
MYRILEREDLTDTIHVFKIDAPAVAKKAKPGQFVILRVSEEGERIPLTIADFDRKAGTITVVFMEVGKTTMEMAKLGVGDCLTNFAGPLGQPTEIEKFGRVVVVGGGFGVATTYPIARAMKEAGNEVITIMGARNKDLLIWEDRMRSASSELIICTDDGSLGRQGLVTAPLKEMLEAGVKVDRVVAIGPAIMMKFVALTTQPFGVHTVVSLNPLMVDGTGLCGACRVSIDGHTKFACVDGPDFDGHQVDWDLLLSRQKIFVDEEKASLERWLHPHECQCSKAEA